MEKVTNKKTIKELNEFIKECKKVRPIKRKITPIFPPIYHNVVYTNYNPDKIDIKSEWDNECNLMRVDVKLKKKKR